MTIETKLTWNGGRVMQQLNTAAKTGLEKSAKIIINEMKRMMQEPKSGRMYGEHQASAPGEAPAVETGKLINGLQYKIEGVADKPTLVIKVNDAVTYAKYLEFGTKKMEPRPFMRPAITNMRRRVEMTIALEIQKVLNKK